MMLTVPLVGMHFRPPAKQVLAVLPQGCELRLRPEPENPYDQKAIQVLVDPRLIPESQHEALAAAMQGTGSTIEDLMMQELMHLGYIADSDGAVCRKTGRQGNGQVHQAFDLRYGSEFISAAFQWAEVKAKLGFYPDGAPSMVVEL